MIGSQSCSLVVELSNDDQWRSLPSDPSGVTCGWPAMGSRSCWQLGFHAW